MRDFASPCLGVCYDCGHANIMEKHMPQSVMYSSWAACGKNADEIEWDENSLEKLIPHIVMCHLHDNNGITDQHLLPGEGTVDFDAVFAGLEKAPRLLSYQSETLPLKNQITGRKLGKTWLEFLKKY
jgi:sugar phosphate isomerase/epimerase